MLSEKWSRTGAVPALSVLFEKRERTRTEPLQRGEGLFEFYDRCAGPRYDEFRAVVNGSLAQMPADARNKLISRMRYGGDREFGASPTELSVHAFILGSGCKAIAHPQIPGTAKRPDFLVTDQAGTPWASGRGGRSAACRNPASSRAPRASRRGDRRHGGYDARLLRHVMRSQTQ
jgi:hypothetical protein